MEKLVLRLDDLRIESFTTTAAPDAVRGTVRGHDHTHDDLCAWPTTTLPTARPQNCD
jgi:hypothetical protein